MRKIVYGLILAGLLGASACIHPTPTPPVPQDPHQMNVEVLGVPPGVTPLGALYPDDAAEAPISARADGDMLWFSIPPSYTGRGLINVAADPYFRQFRPTVVGQEVDLLYAGPLDAVTLRYPRPSPEVVANIRMNFIGPHDSQGRVMFSPFFASLSREDQLDWERIWRGQGLTHLLLSVEYDYPGSPIPGGDFRTHLQDFIALGHQVLDDGFVPVLYLTDGHCAPEDDMATVWPQVFAGFNDIESYVHYVPGFEVVGPGACWTSHELNDALGVIHVGAPLAQLDVHFQPERLTGASYPVEPDDPWQGCEPCFWTQFNGQYVNTVLYQTPHGDKLLKTTEADGANWWGDRWEEGLARLGRGELGWRKVAMSFFEVSGYDYYRDNATDADQQRLAAEAAALCARYAVPCTYGNGTP